MDSKVEHKAAHEGKCFFLSISYLQDCELLCPIWAPHCRNDIDILDQVQQVSQKWLWGWRTWSTRTVWEIKYVQLGKERACQDFFIFYNFLIWGYRKEGAGLFLEVHSAEKKGNGHKLEHGKFWFDIRKINSLWSWLNSRKCCPERLWNLCPWRGSKLTWTQTAATWSNQSCS